MKIIRWPGLATFIVLATLSLGGTWLFAGPVVESIMESILTDMNDARVDIASVDIGYSPLSLDVNDIQITDRSRPMINSVQIGKASFSLSFGDLLLKKVIIDNMSLTEIRVDTPRKRSGAIRKAKKATTKTDDEDSLFDFDMPDIGFPDIDELMKNETLQARQTIEQLNQDLDQTRKQWTKIRDDIKDQKRWDQHKARYEQIREDFRGNTADKLAAIQDAKKLRRDLKQELERIRNARRQINTDSDRLEKEYQTARAAPKKDVERIKQKYKLDNLDPGNVTELLFGPQAAEYLTVARTWYRRLKPYLKSGEEEPEIIRSEGEDIAFREFNPRPGFYVRTAAMDAEVPRGQFAGVIEHISSDQSVNGEPTRFRLTGQNMRHRDSEELSGEFNYVDRNQGYSQINYIIKRYRLDDMNISRGNKLSLKMTRSLMDLDINTRLQSGRLTGRADARFDKVQFDVATASSGSLTRMLAASFADVHRFNIHATFSGDLKDMDLDLKSDLDNQVGAQFRNQIEARKQQFERDLQARIDERLREPLASIEEKKQRLDEIKEQLDAKEKELNQQIAGLDDRIEQEKSIKEQKLENKVDDKKEELKKKLLDKLKF